MRSATGLLTRGSLPRRLPGFAPVASWRRSISPYSGGTVPDSHRVPSPCSVVAGEPIIGRCAAHSSETGFPSSPGRRVIFAFSSVPDLGTGLGGWDLVLRKLAHAAEYAILGALLVRATGRAGPSHSGSACSTRSSDEIHQTFVPGRHGAPVDVAIDAVGVAVGIALWQSARDAAPRVTAARRSPSTSTRSATRGRSGRRGSSPHAASSRSIRPTLSVDRGEAAAALDAAGAGNWRTLLERFAEDHAPAYLRRDAATSAALQSLASSGVELGVFTDAPEPLARVALAQLGAARRVSRSSRGAARSSASSLRSAPMPSSCVRATTSCSVRRIVSVEQHDVGDRQLDALLERLDRIADELERLNRTTERQEGFTARRARAPRPAGVAERARLRGARAGAAARSPPR